MKFFLKFVFRFFFFTLFWMHFSEIINGCLFFFVAVVAVDVAFHWRSLISATVLVAVTAKMSRFTTAIACFLAFWAITLHVAALVAYVAHSAA